MLYNHAAANTIDCFNYAIYTTSRFLHECYLKHSLRLMSSPHKDQRNHAPGLDE